MSEEKTMTLHEKLLAMQTRVDGLIKDGKNLSDKYDFASDENVLDRFRPMMDELGLLLIPIVNSAELHEGATRSGTARYLTELRLTMVWHDVESGKEIQIPWYAQGVDLAGEKGVGKALTYAEKYFLLKFFHVPTRKDDPDGDARTRSGEKSQTGTAASKENVDYCRKAVRQMILELYGNDQDKIKAAYLFLTQAKSRGYEGVDSLESVKDPAVPVLYGKLKKQYEKRVGHAFVYQPPKEGAYGE